MVLAMTFTHIKLLPLALITLQHYMLRVAKWREQRWLLWPVMTLDVLRAGYAYRHCGVARQRLLSTSATPC